MSVQLVQKATTFYQCPHDILSMRGVCKCNWMQFIIQCSVLQNVDKNSDCIVTLGVSVAVFNGHKLLKTHWCWSTMLPVAITIHMTEVTATNTCIQHFDILTHITKWGKVFVNSYTTSYSNTLPNSYSSLKYHRINQMCTVTFDHVGNALHLCSNKASCTNEVTIYGSTCWCRCEPTINLLLWFSQIYTIIAAPEYVRS